jgi:16S rRNA (guanine966-N2)-methyltransferase
VGQQLIAQNIAKLRVQDKVTVMRNDATGLGAWPHAPFDLVFLDPPYGKGMGEQALSAARAGGWLASDAFVVWEESAVMDAPDGFTRHDHRRYGDTHVTFLDMA